MSAAIPEVLAATERGWQQLAVPMIESTLNSIQGGASESLKQMLTPENVAKQVKVNAEPSHKPPKLMPQGPNLFNKVTEKKLQDAIDHIVKIHKETEKLKQKHENNSQGIVIDNDTAMLAAELKTLYPRLLNGANEDMFIKFCAEKTDDMKKNNEPMPKFGQEKRYEKLETLSKEFPKWEAAQHNKEAHLEQKSSLGNVTPEALNPDKNVNGTAMSGDTRPTVATPNTSTHSQYDPTKNMKKPRPQGSQ